jgi:hypothetical protein
MWNELALAIIEQAVADYRERKLMGYPTAHLERFFNGEWCDFLLQNMELSGQDILKYLKTR